MEFVKVSDYDFADKSIIVIGAAGTAAALGSVVFFYATAGVGFAAAMIMIVVDGATVLFLGALATGIVWSGKGLIKQVCCS